MNSIIRKLQGTVGLLTILLAIIIVAGFIGLQWRSGIDLNEVRVTGNVVTPTDDLLQLARVDSVEKVFEVDPTIVVDRIVRHPWVRSSKVSRLLSGRLTIKIEEREPVVLATDNRGVPSFYIDSEGYMSPAANEAVFDVPVLYGVASRYHAVKPIDEESLLRLLATMDRQGKMLSDLISEFSVDDDGTITMYTSPALSQTSIPVVLGRDKFAEKFRNLYAFWQQVVEEDGRGKIRKIDLRFDSQIITVP